MAEPHERGAQEGGGALTCVSAFAMSDFMSSRPYDRPLMLRHRTVQSFCVPKAEIAAAGYDLSVNRYKEVVHEAAEHRPPKEIIAELKALEKEIADGLDELEGML
jgi:type I restriction-modification system DNA methylase subunit